MAQYGLTYRIADYIGRSFSNKSSNVDPKFVRSIIDLIKQLDQLQENNPSFTMTVWASDGIWICHNGVRQFLVLPKINNARLIYSKEASNKQSVLHNDILNRRKLGHSIEDKSQQDDYWIWKIEREDLDLILNFVRELPVSHPEVANKSHPRYFPGELRQIAFEAFEKDGRWCAGTKDRPSHQVAAGEPIEFDHILPHARGGSRSKMNIQVLCEACNRAKGATAL